MSWRSTASRIVGFLHGDRAREGDLQEEIRCHIELETDENIGRGMDPTEARRAALLKFGSPRLTYEKSRAMWSVPSLESIISDVRFGWRVLWKNPTFALVGILTLALGVGASTAVFTVGNAVLLRHMPYPRAEQIVLVWGSDGKGGDRGQVSYTDIEDVRRQNRVFAAIANFANWTPTLSGVGDPERLAATQVSDGFFDVIGIRPAQGRPFTAEENIDGRDRVVILSHALWQRRFNSDPSIIGKAIQLNSVPHVVVGVMPEDFEGLPSTLVQGGELYRPIGENYDDTQRRAEHLRAIARLMPGVAATQAQSDVERVARLMESSHPKEDADLHFHVAPLQEDTAQTLRPSIVVMGWAVLMLLLIACANVAGLLLARGSSRQREFAMRTALGASKLRIVRQQLTESLVMGSVAGVLGLGIAYAGTKVCALLAPKLGSPLAHVAVDPKVVAFNFLVVLLTSAIFGLAPALRAAALNLSSAIKDGASSLASGSGRRLHSAVVVAELSMALAMVMIAAMLVQSFIKMQRVELGFQADDRMVLSVWIPESKYKDRARKIAFYEELLRRVSSLPGIDSAAMVQNPPLGDFDGRAILPEGRSDEPQNYLSPQAYIITPTYLRTMGIAVVDGREFTESDNESGQQVAIVSKSLAQAMFPGESAIGKRLQLLSDQKVDDRFPFRTIVGVVGDVRHLGPEAEVRPGLYVPFKQLPVSFMTIVVHASHSRSMVPAIRRELAALDPEIAAFRIGTYAEFLANAVLLRRVAMMLIVVFGATSLFLAAVGLYGLQAFIVSRRIREFGVRAALGAMPADIVRLVLRSGVVLIALGAGLGILGSVFSLKFAASVIVGSELPEPQTVVVAFGTLILVSIVAITLPARAASKVDPAITLRSE